MSTVDKKVKTTLKPFTIEADSPNNGDIMLHSLTGCRIRSRIKSTRRVFDKDRITKEQVTRQESAHLLPGMPADIPGMRIEVHPGKSMYRVYDPLCDNEEMCESIGAALGAQNGTPQKKVRGIKTYEGELGTDLLKTLLRELYNIVQSEDGKVVKGLLPEMEDIDALEGDYLLNPSNRTKYHMPRYEKDLDTWAEKLNRLG